jgi:predicted nucleotidyltransferase
VEGLRERIAEINNSQEYMVRVIEAVVFGSYLKGDSRIGDIASRSQEKTERARDDWDRAALKDFRACGRTEKTILDAPYWPEYKVRLKLNNRQRAISLHDMDEFLALQRKAATPFEVLIGDKGRILKDVQHRKLPYK